MEGRSGPKIFDPDFALAVLSEVGGKALAQSLQSGLEYAPHHKTEARQAAALMENAQ